MLIAIPSKGRPGKVRTWYYLKRGTIFVPKTEVPAYEACGYPDVVGVPMSVRGITATRNWILRSAKSERWVVFVDDDLKRTAWIELFSENGVHRDVPAETMLVEWVRLFEIVEALKYRCWGLSTDGALRSVYPYRPFIFRTYVTASCMGLINDGRTFFDEAFKVKEDYELVLRLIEEDGGILGARYLYWQNRHWKDPGGCHDYRTQAMEREAIAALMRKYPGRVRRQPNKQSEFTIALDF